MGAGGGARPALGTRTHAGRPVSVTSAVSATTSLPAREITEAVRRDAGSGAAPQLHTHSEKQESPWHGAPVSLRRHISPAGAPPPPGGEPRGDQLLG